ncbi:uncharacterized protein LOC142982342 [Anticarsia gemmatalis]|uniref:uncharacterized protein LOC142982342 n=1 Tax=Anticarsia gemmatalis TaxID=129554 RepID=UPI003F768AD9
MDVEAAAAITLFAVSLYHYIDVKNKKVIKRKRSKKRWWMTEIHRNRSRLTMEKQLSELHSEPSGEFKKLTRMSTIDFEYLLQKVSPIISKKDTQFRPAIPARIRLAMTLRLLASGDSYESLHFLFKISPQLISEIVIEVCKALVHILKNEIKIPDSVAEWLEIENGFKNKEQWQVSIQSFT